MADPIISPNSPPTLTPGAEGTPTQTQTGGLDDPTFLAGIEAAFQQAGKTPGTESPAPAQPSDDEPEDVLKPPPKEEPPKPPEQQPKPPEPPPKQEKARTKSEQWKELHRLKDEAQRRADELEAKWKQAEERAKAVDPEEYKRVKSERDDYENRLKAFAVEHDPAFEQQMSTRLNRIKTEAETALGEHATRFMSLLSLPEGEFKRQQIATMLGDVDEFTKFSMMQLANDHRKLSIERNEFVKNARENYQKILDTQARQAEALRTKVLSDFDSTVKQWQDPKNGIAALQYKEGDEAWNNEVRGTIDLAKNILTGKLPPEELIRASLWSAAAPRILKSMHALQTENASMKAELEKLKVAQPDAATPGSGESVTEAEEEYKGMSYPEIIAHKVLNAGGFGNR